MKEELSDFLKIAYKYFDGKKGTNHFFVIIDKDDTAVPIENFGMLISSNLDKLKYRANKLFEKDNLNNLHRDSIVKTDVLYKILNEQIIFKIGTVDSEKIEEYKKGFYESLQDKKLIDWNLMHFNFKNVFVWLQNRRALRKWKIWNIRK